MVACGLHEVHKELGCGPWAPAQLLLHLQDQLGALDSPSLLWMLLPPLALE